MSLFFKDPYQLFSAATLRYFLILRHKSFFTMNMVTFILTKQSSRFKVTPGQTLTLPKIADSRCTVIQLLTEEPQSLTLLIFT